MALRFDLYRGVYRVSRLLRPRPRRAQRIYFIVHIRSHVRLSIEAFKLLKARHHDCVFVRGNPDQPSAQVELAQHGLTCISLANLVSSYRPGDLVLTFLDWYPPRTLVIAIRMLKKLGARIIGINESFRYTTRTQYKRVELRLTWGPEEPQKGSKPVTIVGSPAIENHLKLQWKPVSPAFALVNYKFDFNKRDSNAAWQKLVVGACQDVGLRTVFSVHPSTTEIPDYIVKTNRDLSDLLPECSVSCCDDKSWPSVRCFGWGSRLPSMGILRASRRYSRSTFFLESWPQTNGRCSRTA